MARLLKRVKIGKASKDCAVIYEIGKELKTDQLVRFLKGVAQLTSFIKWARILRGIRKWVRILNEVKLMTRVKYWARLLIRVMK